jgi:hypothetical protein
MILTSKGAYDLLCEPSGATGLGTKPIYPGINQHITSRKKEFVERIATAPLSGLDYMEEKLEVSQTIHGCFCSRQAWGCREKVSHGLTYT